MNTRQAVSLSLLLVCACIGTKYAKPTGENARIVLKDGMRLNAELLAVTPDNLYLICNGRVCRSPLRDVSRVHVAGLTLIREKCLALGLIGVADAFTAWYSTAACGQFYPAAVIPAVFAVGAASTLEAEPKVDFGQPFRPEELELLALYGRYSRGLTDAQWQELLDSYEQSDFATPGGSPGP